MSFGIEPEIELLSRYLEEINLLLYDCKIGLKTYNLVKRLKDVISCGISPSRRLFDKILSIYY